MRLFYFFLPDCWKRHEIGIMVLEILNPGSSLSTGSIGFWVGFRMTTETFRADITLGENLSIQHVYTTENNYCLSRLSSV